GCPVNFTDQSAGVPTAWHWTFEGSNTPSSTEKNPSDIIYENEGQYTVKLVVSNEMGLDSLIMTNYVSVSSAVTPIADFDAPVRTFCNDNGIVTFFDSSNYCPIAWEWSFEPASVTFVEGTTSASRNPVVMFNEVGAYDVTLTASNLNGSNTVTKDDFILIGGEYLPFAEDFESGSFSTRSWNVENPDNSITWDIATVGGTSPGNKAARMNIFQYQVVPGQRDRLISPPFNLTGYGNAYLSFLHAYAQEYAPISDSLIVYISTDCGTNWTRLLSLGENGSGNFATHPLTTEEFIPQTAEDWCGGGFGSGCNTIDLSPWVGMQDIRIMFESYHYLGNNIYVDNATLFTTVALDQAASSKTAVTLYPNPSTGSFTLYVTGAPSDLYMKIMNLSGQIIYHQKFNAGSGYLLEEINLDNSPKGIYLVEVSGRDLLEHRKLILH
ncbi:MAG TPA: PKD domain-containing protein, partial [Bacteroidales bacterium]|nr:PKD domain-containing protein [Bacteroidales bacterium]